MLNAARRMIRQVARRLNGRPIFWSETTDAQRDRMKAAIAARYSA